MRVIDLSQDIHPGMQLFPAYPHPSFILWTKRENYGFEAEVVMMATHTGTHVDAPYHFSPNGVGISEVSLESLMGEAVVLDFSDSQGKELITASQIRAAEKNSATIRGGDIVLLRTGWTRFLGKPEYLSSYPGLSRDAAELFTAIGVKAVGVDSPTPTIPTTPPTRSTTRFYPTTFSSSKTSPTSPASSSPGSGSSASHSSSAASAAHPSEPSQ